MFPFAIDIGIFMLYWNQAAILSPLNEKIKSLPLACLLYAGRLK